MNEPGFLLWAHVVLIFAIANYISRDPLLDEIDVRATAQRFRALLSWRAWVIGRAALAAITVAYLSAGFLPGAVVLCASIALPFLRAKVRPRFCAELEVVAVSAFAIGALWITSTRTLRLANTVFEVPVSNLRLAVGCTVVALFVFTINGGTYVVRGILKKSGAVPMLASNESGGRAVDVNEFNRGRLIGALERVLLFAVVIAGSYEALGFVIAAKGLVRSREFEISRDMTEYFLIGSLSSVLIALATGSAARYVIQTYW
ncbi:MAG: hypothetical protein ACREXK_10535 [Gammaproteobacteria bacterium]